MSSDEENRDAFTYVPQSVQEEMPGLGETDGMPWEERVVHIKLFTPLSSFTWFLVEYSPEENLAWGFTHRSDVPEFSEWGNVSISELEGVTRELSTGTLRLVERDVWWTPRPVTEVDEISVPGGAEEGGEGG